MTSTMVLSGASWPAASPVEVASGSKTVGGEERWRCMFCQGLSEHACPTHGLEVEKAAYMRLKGKFIIGSDDSLLNPLVNRIAFALSLAHLLTSGTYRMETNRGLARWTLNFVLNGPNAAFRKQQG